MTTPTDTDYAIEIEYIETEDPGELGREKVLRRTARVISWLLNPFIIPLLVFTILFVFT